MPSPPLDKKPRKDWDKKQISRSYEDTAQQAENYLNRCREGAKTQEGYKPLHDEHLAKFYLYNYLHGRIFLESPSELLRELQRLLGSPPKPPRECFDPECFVSWYRVYVEGEISGLATES